jgi:hypothetical protein
VASDCCSHFNHLSKVFYTVSVGQPGKDSCKTVRSVLAEAFVQKWSTMSAEERRALEPLIVVMLGLKTMPKMNTKTIQDDVTFA